jgi:tRNA-splicing ligase RtcB (3'-phosphate/5'-hydroxy nucleic acid ligase)
MASDQGQPRRTRVEDVMVFGAPDEASVRQILTCRHDPNAVAAALMADHHKGYSQPIGGVVVYEEAISPSGVGYDIACGNKAVLTDLPARDVKRDIRKIMDRIWRDLEFGIGRTRSQPAEHELFDDPTWRDVKGLQGLQRMAREQLGTVGSGNHYVDLFEDEQGRIWIGVHFGSRGFGHRTASGFLNLAKGRKFDDPPREAGMDAPATVFPIASAVGQDYLSAMKLAGRYAYAGRDQVCADVARMLGAKVLEEVHNHHNFAWEEEHGGRKVIVVRKGATPAFPGQKGFVGGSMGDISVILEGVDSPASRDAYFSTVHGAGRVMSRTEAAGKKRWGHRGRGPTRKGGKITREMMLKWVHEAGVELRGAGTDESPHCYKRLPEVLRDQGETIRILHTLKPLGVAMAGEDVEDPFVD